MSGWSEDELHRWLAEQPWPRQLAGTRGHDAAVLGAFSGHPVVCVDQCIEGVHFEGAAPAERVGAKAVLRTLSDLAATASRPVAVTLALSASAGLEAVWIQALLTGAARAAEEFGAELAAGDLAQREGSVHVSVSAFGVFGAPGSPTEGHPPPGRARAAAGQALWLSGPVGGSLPSGRHLKPIPRMDEGEAAVAAGATGMMDVSDGLAWDLFRLARAAGVGVELETGLIPIHGDADVAATASGRSALHHALHDGEDHELVATIDDSVALPDPWVRVGRIVPGRGLRLRGNDGADPRDWAPSEGGWKHGQQIHGVRGLRPSGPSPGPPEAR